MPPKAKAKDRQHKQVEDPCFTIGTGRARGPTMVRLAKAIMHSAQAIVDEWQQADAELRVAQRALTSRPGYPHGRDDGNGSDGGE